jgi:hypothetical protein
MSPAPDRELAIRLRIAELKLLALVTANIYVRLQKRLCEHKELAFKPQARD